MELHNSILIVEDEIAIAELLKLALVDDYFKDFPMDIEIAHTTEQAREKMNLKKYDLILLDWMLPTEQGIDFLRAIKSESPKNQASFMMMTAKSDPDSIVEGLEAGADDFMTKPFEMIVFKARVKNILGRRQALQKANKPSLLEFSGLSLDLEKIEVKLQNQLIHLTPSEFKLLGFLLESQGKVLTRDRLIDLIQGEDVSVTGRTIDTHVFALRKKLSDWGQNIETIRGVGYRIISN